MERARAQLATLLGCMPREIVFTSGGTESNNLALAGTLQPYLLRNEPVHLLTTQIEHHAVIYAAEALERLYPHLEVTYLRPARDGVIDPVDFAAALKPHTRLVSVMLANNETGAIQPLGKFAHLAKQNNPKLLVHTDAVQAVGKLAVDLSGEFRNVDLLSLSGHKMYAPQGTGALFVRKGVELAPLFYGGPHERQRRAGTENVPGIVGLGCAAALSDSWIHSGAPAQLASLRDHLEQHLLAAIPDAQVNAGQTLRAPNTTNFQCGGVDAEALLIALDLAGVSASFGAACQSGATEPSHVLLAMGFTPAEARSSLRISLSRLTTPAEVERALAVIPVAVRRLRSLLHPS